MCDVSFIIVNWNTKQLLLDCIKSIYETVNNTFEVIVVDNASTDDSVDAVKEQFSQVILIENSENLGFSKANNAGILESKGRYVCLVNSDVVILKNCVDNLVTFMDQSPETGMVGPRILNPDLTLQPQCRHLPSLWNNFCQSMAFDKLFPKSSFFSGPFMKYWSHDEVRQVDVITGCFWLVRREAVHEVGSLDEVFFMYGEDVDWCKRFHKKKWKVVFYPESEAIHFGGASSSNAPIKYYLEMQKSDLLYWKKHHGRLGEFGYRIILLLRHFIRIVVHVPAYLLCPSKRNSLALKINRSFQCMLLGIGFSAIRKY